MAELLSDYFIDGLVQLIFQATVIDPRICSGINSDNVAVIDPYIYFTATIHDDLVETKKFTKVEPEASVYMAGVLDYLIREVFGSVKLKPGEMEIEDVHIQQGISSHDDLRKLYHIVDAAHSAMPR